MSQSQPPFFMVSMSLIVFVAFVVFVLCFISLRGYVDLNSLEKEEINRIIKGAIPPYSSLTEEGKLRYRIAKRALICWSAGAAAMIIYKILN